MLPALFRAALVAGLIDVASRIVSFSTLVRLIGVRLGAPGASDSTETGLAAEELLDSPAVRAADIIFRNWPARSSCLQRALLFGYLLRAHRPVLRIGVRRDRDDLQAHAWLELAGGHVLEAASRRGYTTLSSLDGAVEHE